MKIGLFFQANNFVGPEYYWNLVASGFDPIPVRWGVMSHESRGRERDRTGGLWNPDEIPSIPYDFSEWGDSAISKLAEFDVCINGGVPGKIPPHYLRAPKWGWLNVHPGKLPDFRGSSCPEWAVLLGKPVVCTAHEIDDGLDTGPVICETKIPYDPALTYTQFRASIYPTCGRTLVNALKAIQSGAARLSQVGEGTTWPPMPKEVLTVVKRRFFPFHPGVM